MDSVATNPKSLVRRLADSSPVIRDRAVKQFQQFVTAAGREFGEMDMIKLWRGLYYAMYHADSDASQSALANVLVSTAMSIPHEGSRRNYIVGFWLTMGEFWQRLDRHRIDKFMMLVRRFVKMLADHTLIEEFFFPWMSDEKCVPKGLIFHIIDVFPRTKPADVSLWLARIPHYSDKTLREYLSRNMFDHESTEEWAPKMREHVSKSAFQIAKDPEMPETGRRLLHSISERLLLKH